MAAATLSASLLFSIVLFAGDLATTGVSGTPGPAPCRVIRESGAKTLYLEDASGIAVGQRMIVVRTDSDSAGSWELTRVTEVDGAFLTISPPLRKNRRSGDAGMAKACVVNISDRARKADLINALQPSFENAATEPTGHFGTITVLVRPWAEIWLDGTKVAAETPLRHFRLSAGQHSLRLVNPNASYEQEQSVEVRADRETHIVADIFAGTFDVRGW